MISSKLTINNLLLLSLIFVLIVSSCQQSEKNFFISDKEITLEPDTEQTIYLGVKNTNNEDKKFKLSYECENCNKEISLQMFSEIGLKANREGAFPIKIIANKNSKNNEYKINLIITDIKKDSVYFSDIINVEIKKFNQNFTKSIV